MFCKNCGKEISETSKFCSVCGTQLENVEISTMPPSGVNANTITKEQLLSEMSLHKRYFNEVIRAASVYDVQVDTINKVNEYKELIRKNFNFLILFGFFSPKKLFRDIPNAIKALSELDKILKNHNSPSTNGKTANILFVLNIVFGNIGALLIFAGAMLSTSSSLLTLGCLLLFGSVVTFFVSFIFYRKYAKDAERFANELNNSLPQLQNSIQNEINDIMDKIYGNYLYTIVLPDEYFYPEAVDFIDNALRTCRADNLKEAVNLYFDYVQKEEHHRQNQEAQSHIQELLLEQKEGIDRLNRQVALYCFADGLQAIGNSF